MTAPDHKLKPFKYHLHQRGIHTCTNIPTGGSSIPRAVRDKHAPYSCDFILA